MLSIEDVSYATQVDAFMVKVNEPVAWSSKIKLVLTFALNLKNKK